MTPDEEAANELANMLAESVSHGLLLATPSLKFGAVVALASARMLLERASELGIITEAPADVLRRLCDEVAVAPARIEGQTIQ